MIVLTAIFALVAILSIGLAHRYARVADMWQADAHAADEDREAATARYETDLRTYRARIKSLEAENQALRVAAEATRTLPYTNGPVTLDFTGAKKVSRTGSVGGADWPYVSLGTNASETEKKPAKRNPRPRRKPKKGGQP